MLFVGVEPRAVPDPGLFGGAHLGVREGLEEGHLDADFLLEPEVVRIEEGDELALGQPEAGVTGGAHATVRQGVVRNSITVFRHNLPGVVVRAVVDDQELEHRGGGPAFEIILAEDRVDGFGKKKGPVIGRDDDGDHVSPRS